MRTQSMYQDLYQDVEVNTVPKVNLVTMCYDKIIELLNEAITEINLKRYDKKFQLLSRATSIITELMAALDFKNGKQVAYGLNNIYLYCLNKIMESDSKDDGEGLKEVINIINELNEAWKKIAKKDKSTKYDHSKHANLRI